MRVRVKLIDGRVGVGVGFRQVGAVDEAKSI